MVEHLEGLLGTGRASTDLGAIAQAAGHGRVEALFLTVDPWCWNQISQGAAAVVALGVDAAYAACEASDTAATDTLVNDGQVYVTSQRIAQGSDVAAVFRY